MLYSTNKAADCYVHIKQHKEDCFHNLFLNIDISRHFIMSDIENVDLYQLLGIESDADDATIKTAYRKQALLCHPDKNPEDPYAEHSFRQLSQAIQILLDRDSRKAYDFHRTKVSKLSNSIPNLSEKVQNSSQNNKQHCDNSDVEAELSKGEYLSKTNINNDLETKSVLKNEKKYNLWWSLVIFISISMIIWLWFILDKQYFQKYFFNDKNVLGSFNVPFAT